MNFNPKQLLGRWLKEKGIPNYYAMSPEEKQTYREMEASLTEKALTDEDVKDFWNRTFKEITDKLTKEDLSEKERDFLIVELRFAKKIQSFLTSSETQVRNARIMVEQQLSNN